MEWCPKSGEEYKEKFLIKTKDIVEVDYIATMLKEMDISYRAVEDTAQYIDVMGGQSFDSISIYVDESRLEEAKELLLPLEEKQQTYGETSDYAIDLEQEEQTDEEEDDLQQKVIRKYRRAFLYALLSPIGILFAIGIVIVFIGFVYTVVSFIINGGL